MSKLNLETGEIYGGIGASAWPPYILAADVVEDLTQEERATLLPLAPWDRLQRWSELHEDEEES